MKSSRNVFSFSYLCTLTEASTDEYSKCVCVLSYFRHIRHTRVFLALKDPVCTLVCVSEGICAHRCMCVHACSCVRIPVRM